MKNRITVLISETETSWAYSVSINKDLHKIGYGTTYREAVRLATRGVKSAQAFLDAEGK